MDSKTEIINKIKSIMRLAHRASTDGEKNAAEAAASRLAKKAGVALSEIEVNDSEIRTDTFCDEKLYARHAIELGYITAVLRQHFGIILMQNYNPAIRKLRITWIGTKINVEVAKYVYKILMRECRKACGEARVVKRMVRDYHYRDPALERRMVALRNISQKAFYDGWFGEIHRKLLERPLRNDMEQFEAEKRDAEEFLERLKRQQNISDDKVKNHKGDLASVMLGVKAAAKVNLSRPCDGNGYTGPNTQLGVTHTLEMK